MLLSYTSQNGPTQHLKDAHLETILMFLKLSDWQFIIYTFCKIAPLSFLKKVYLSGCIYTGFMLYDDSPQFYIVFIRLLESNWFC
jgi:hypothetical protein